MTPRTVTIELFEDGDWIAAWCPEIPEANGQGRTEAEAIASLAAAIALVKEGQGGSNRCTSSR